MLVHVVCLQWSEGTTAQQLAHVVDGLGRLPALIPSIRAYRFGADVGLAPGNYDFAIVAEFDDADGYLACNGHPEHQAVIVERIRPILAGRTAVQFRSDAV